MLSFLGHIFSISGSFSSHVISYSVSCSFRSYSAFMVVDTSVIVLPRVLESLFDHIRGHLRGQMFAPA